MLLFNNKYKEKIIKTRCVQDIKYKHWNPVQDVRLYCGQETRT